MSNPKQTVGEYWLTNGPKIGGIFSSPISYHPDREKRHGRMWSGKAVMDLNAVPPIKFYFDMWHHGPDEDPGQSDMIKHFALKGLSINDKYYDTYWHVFFGAGEIWLHEKGWFGSGDTIPDQLPMKNWNWDIPESVTEDTKSKLLELGFKKIL